MKSTAKGKKPTRGSWELHGRALDTMPKRQAREREMRGLIGRHNDGIVMASRLYQPDDHTWTHLAPRLFHDITLLRQAFNMFLRPRQTRLINVNALALYSSSRSALRLCGRIQSYVPADSV